MRLRFIASSILMTTLMFTSAGLVGQVPQKPLHLEHAVQDKNFYLLSAIEDNSRVSAALLADKDLQEIAPERTEYLNLALRSCKGDAVCTMRSFLWTEEEIRIVSFALERLYRDSPALQEMVDQELRPSGTYILYQNKGGAELLSASWEICARGMNNVIAVYGQGAAPRYPLIDSISFDVNSQEFRQKITALAQQPAAESPNSELFFASSLKAALELLAMNRRDEAGREEPMETGGNAAAIKALPGVAWKKYPYSVIVVPGAGPSDPDTALSEAGRARTKLAAEAYHAGKAPFVLVSGGYVHPSQTRFAEALEMKKALLADYGVPASAILIDPHARHTTTNLRDAVREIYRYEIPMNKPVIVISDKRQIDGIASQAFRYRCLKEMGYLPYKITDHPSDTSVVFLPKIESLQQDPLDPLDP
ncbi:YdcF family protein [Edaphobacter sp. HDX4]|uniref:YdcF family protein n=1 Tax=Edaphobacter sp. HDX4 TaxID=2794064 RepID=UPI002FE634E1